MKQYLDIVQEILKNGERKTDRTKTGTFSVFGMQKRYDLRDGFPLVTTKYVNFQNILYELLWFLRGSTNINDDLTQHTKIWDAWADKNGELGPIYGYQWIRWEKFTGQPGKNYKKSHINQIQNAIDLIKSDPSSRRIIVTAWNPADLNKMALPPCHTFFQFNVANEYLDCQLYQRSADVALGVPYNIASYSALLTMAAQECNLIPRYFIHTLGDAHIYLNHVDGLRGQLKRKPYPMPKLQLKKKRFWNICIEDFKLLNYKYHEAIKFNIAV